MQIGDTPKCELKNYDENRRLKLFHEDHMGRITLSDRDGEKMIMIAKGDAAKLYNALHEWLSPNVRLKGNTLVT